MYRRLSCAGIALVLSLTAGSAFGELMAHYPLDEGSGTLVADASGYGHDGTAQAEPTWVEGPPGFGTALFFDGANPAPAWVDCGRFNPSENSGQLTVGCWVQWGGLSGSWQGVVAKRDGWDDTETGVMWYLEVNQGTGVIFFGRFGQVPCDGGELPIGEWRHVAVAADGTTATFFVNGEETGSGDFTFGPAVNATVMIGADNLGGANGFSGAIDEVRIYDMALAQEEIQGMMTEARAPLVRALAPNPGNMASEVPTDVVLSWIPGDYAATHDLYFGTSFEDVNQATRDNPLDVMLATDLAEPVYELADPLDYGQTYYWRVDEVNDAEPNSPWVGNVWSFTVRNFLMVDDFESYNDEDNIIYETWIDGWVNGTGSTVGYFDPPYAEQMFVHKGDQSMPLLYNNFFDPYYSQADREWEQPQDWTNLSPVSLTIWIRGDQDNSEEPFYAAVADSGSNETVVVNSDSAVVQTQAWQAWDIPLSTLTDAGLDLTGVTRLSVGVGNVLAPSSGFNGTVFVDDIRLMLP